jgi:hypothetical protein
VYYDTFVRHAFGNYRDILREASFSPVMGDYLTYRENKAFSFSGNYPDENFAREYVSALSQPPSPLYLHQSSGLATYTSQTHATCVLFRIMQLFTVGLYDVHPDGEPVLNSQGRPTDAYSNDDIVAFARVWTGFDRQSRRGNVEQVNGNSSANMVDPMQIKPDWHDRLPKTKLDSGYLGDGFPLCLDLPTQEFLRQGAVFELTGASSTEGEVVDAATELPHEVFQAEDASIITGSIVSAARGWVVFSDTAGGVLEWQSQRSAAEVVQLRVYYYLTGDSTSVALAVNGAIVLDAWALPSTDSGNRLVASTAVSINLVSGGNTIRITSTGTNGPTIDFIAFGGDGAVRTRLSPTTASPLYQQLCNPVGGVCTFPVTVTLSENLGCAGDECTAGRVTSVLVVDPSTGLRQYYTHRPRPCVRLALFGNGRVTQQGERRQCTQEEAPMSVSCCSTAATTTPLLVDILADDCLFANEAVTYADALTRCTTRNGTVCTAFPEESHFQWSCAEDTFVWTTAQCVPQIQVYPDGAIGLVDPVTTDTTLMWEYMRSSGNTFRVRWDDNDAVPLAVSGCGDGCSVVAATIGSTCLCNITVATTVPFGNPAIPPSVVQIEATLFVGAVSPAVHDANTYVQCMACPTGITVWTLTSDGGDWTRDTIFELPSHRSGGPPR